MSAEDRFALHHLHTANVNVEQLCAHSAHVGLLDQGGGFTTCSNDGACKLEVNNGAGYIERVCWSPCGSFLILADSLGLLQLFDVTSKVNVWRKQLPRLEEDSVGESEQRCLVRELLCLHGSNAASLVLLVAYASKSESSVDLHRCEIEFLVPTEQQQIRCCNFADSFHQLPGNLHHFVVSSYGVGSSFSLVLYACSDSQISVFDLAKASCCLRAAESLPELSEKEGGPSEHIGFELTAKEVQPQKRRRVSNESRLSLEGMGCVDNVACLVVWPGDSSSNSVCLEPAEEIIAITFRSPGIVVLFDAELLFELSRWYMQADVDILAAAKVSVPQHALLQHAQNSQLDDGLVGCGWRSLALGVVLANNLLLVCVPAQEQVLYSVSLEACCGSNVLLATPPSSGPITTSQAAIAFVVTTAGPTTQQHVGTAEMVLSALLSLVPEDAVDRAEELDDTMPLQETEMETLEQQTTASLRRQLELLMERAAQGKIQLRASSVLRLTRVLVSHIPGFVVGGVLRAFFADSAEMREALQGTLVLLQQVDVLQTSYDHEKDKVLLVEALARLVTFEYLHGALADVEVGPGNMDISHALPVAAGIMDVTSQQPTADGMGREIPGRRFSIAGHGAEGATQAAAKATSRRRHSLPSIRETKMLLNVGPRSRGVAELLARLPDLQGVDFNVVWQQFRCAELAQICLDLVDVECLAEAFEVFSRHSAKFTDEEVMAFVKSLPLEMGAEHEQRLPVWLAQHVLPRLRYRAPLLNWLAERARLLEALRRSPDAALLLLRAVLGTISGRFIDGTSQHFPKAHIARTVFWSNFPTFPCPSLRLLSNEQVAAAEDKDLLQLFQLLLCCAQIKEMHSLTVSLQDMQKEHAPKLVALRLLGRVLAPELLGEEVREHIDPFCRWQGLDLDEILEEYVEALAQSLCLGDPDVRLQRAAALLCCMSAVSCRSRSLQRLLQHVDGHEVPVTLRPLVEEAQTWPAAERAAVQEQLTLLEVGRIWRKHGQSNQYVTHRDRNFRFVHQLLAREDGEVEPLQDALVVIDAFPQRVTRAEALFTRLTHVAAGVEGKTVSSDELQVRIGIALDLAMSLEERTRVATMFAAYAGDLLAEWAGGIEEVEMNQGSTQFANGGGSSLQASWRDASSALCKLAVYTLLQASCGSHCKLVSASGRPAESNSCELALHIFTRLRSLQEEFGLFLDPMLLVPKPPSNCSVFRDSDNMEMFLRHAETLMGFFLSNWEQYEANRASANGNTGEAAAEPPAGSTLTRLLRLGGLLGIDQFQVHQVIVVRASARGLLSVCSIIISKLLQAQCWDDKGKLVQLVQGLLRKICECRGSSRRPAELLLQLTHLEETLAACIALSSGDDISPLLQLTIDVQLAVDILMSSDILDNLAQIPWAWPRLQDLPLTHSHHLGSLHRAEGACVMGLPERQGGDRGRYGQVQSDGLLVDFSVIKRSFAELPLLLAGKVATQASVEYLSRVHLVPQAEVPEEQLARSPIPGSNIATPTSEFLPHLCETFQSSECMELALQVLLRHHRDFGGSINLLRQLCRECSIRILRASCPIDNVLAVAYLGCLEPNEAVENVFNAALNFLHTQNCTDQRRLRSMGQLGADLGAIWGEGRFRRAMLNIGRAAKWGECSRLLNISPDGAKSSGSAQGAELDAGSARSQLPQLIRAARFNQDLAVRFGVEHCLSAEEVLVTWGEVCLTAPEAAPGAAEARAMLPATWKELNPETAPSFLMKRVLPHVSPYDYDRIGLIMKCVGNPHAEPFMQGLKILRDYRRVASPTEIEQRSINAARTKLTQEWPCHIVDAEIARMVKQAEQHLPWHLLAMVDDPWPVLEAEMQGHEPPRPLLFLCQPLGLNSDDFCVRFLKQPRTEDGPCPSLILPKIRDRHKAFEVALYLEEAAPLGPRKVALARSRLEIAQRLLNSNRESCSSDWIVEQRQQLTSLESRTELASAGMSVFDDMLLRGEARSTITCIYYFLPLLLTWNAGPIGRQPLQMPSEESTLGDAARAAQRLGVQGVHQLVDSICGRHGLSPKQQRHRLIEQWLLGTTAMPPQAPPVLVEAEAARLVRLSSSHFQLDEVKFRGQLEDVAPKVGFAIGQLFHLVPAQHACLERLICLARPRHQRNEADLPKDLREDVNTRCVMLLRRIFTNKTGGPYDMKCRAFYVLFRIASSEDIKEAYRNNIDELCDIWKFYAYMDSFQKLGVPQDFNRFVRCSKDGLVRSLWRSHQVDPNMVQLIAALCLDFGVHDSRIWASILSCLQRLQKLDFLRDVLVAVHMDLVLSLPHDPSLVAIMGELFSAPLGVLENWHQRRQEETSRMVAWLPILPRLLRQSPFVASINVPSLACRLLAAACELPAGLSQEARTQLMLTMFPQKNDADLWCGDLQEARKPQLTRDLGGFSTASSDEQRDTATNVELFMQRLAVLALEVALCCPNRTQVHDLVQKEIAEQRPQLIIILIPYCGMGPRIILFEGILQHQLVVQAKALLNKDIFEEFVNYSVATGNIEQLLEAALLHNQLLDARWLLLQYAQHHQLASIEQLVASPKLPAGCSSHEEPETTRLLVALVRLQTSAATMDAYAMLSAHLCGPAGA